MTGTPTGINGPAYKSAVPDEPPRPGEPLPYSDWRSEHILNLPALVLALVALVALAALLLLAWGLNIQNGAPA